MSPQDSSGGSRDLDIYTEECDECGRPTSATVRELAHGVKCVDCKPTPNKL
jgi:hypothetical protein